MSVKLKIEAQYPGEIFPIKYKGNICGDNFKSSDLDKILIKQVATPYMPPIELELYITGDGKYVSSCAERLNQLTGFGVPHSLVDKEILFGYISPSKMTADVTLNTLWEEFGEKPDCVVSKRYQSRIIGELELENGKKVFVVCVEPDFKIRDEREDGLDEITLQVPPNIIPSKIYMRVKSEDPEIPFPDYYGEGEKFITNLLRLSEDRVEILKNGLRQRGIERYEKTQKSLENCDNSELAETAERLWEKIISSGSYKDPYLF